MGNVDESVASGGCLFAGATPRSQRRRLADEAVCCDQLDAEVMLRCVQRASTEQLCSEIEYAEQVRLRLALDASYEKRALGSRQKIQRVVGRDVAELLSLQQLIRVNQTIALLRTEVKHRAARRTVAAAVPPALAAQPRPRDPRPVCGDTAGCLPLRRRPHAGGTM